MCFLFSFLFFLHSDILDLAYLKSLTLKIILFTRMRNGGRAAGPRGASCSSRAAATGGAKSSSPRLLPCRCWRRYCYCKTRQRMEMRYSKSAALHWPKGHSFADTLGQNRSFLIRLGSVLGFGGFGVFFFLWFQQWAFETRPGISDNVILLNKKSKKVK